MADAAPSPLDHINPPVRSSAMTAHSILKADTAGQPAPMAVPEGTVLGRLTGGNVAALTPAQINTLTTGNSLVNTVAATGATETIPAGYEFHSVTMDQSCTFTFASPAGSGHAFALRLSGAFTPTWPASVKWSGGAAPTHTTPAVYVFVTVDGGTTWLGSQMGKAFA